MPPERPAGGVLDADGHVLEPWEAWRDLPAHQRPHPVLDEPTLPILAPVVGEERIVWGSDDPHADSTFPGAVRELRKTLAPLPEAARLRSLGTNAAALYGLEGRALGAVGDAATSGRRPVTSP